MFLSSIISCDQSAHFSQWVVGCKIPACAVMPAFNELNPDMHDERYNTGMGEVIKMKDIKEAISVHAYIYIFISAAMQLLFYF